MVDEITEGFEELQLEHPTGDGETQLGLAMKTPCLWRKEHIKLPNWTPDTSPMYLLFLMLFLLFWTLICMI